MGELWTTKSVWFRADRPHLWLRRPPGNGSERAGACAAAVSPRRTRQAWGCGVRFVSLYL